MTLRPVAFFVAAHDAEMVARRVSQRDPPAAVILAEICDLGCTEQHNALNLVIAATVTRREVEVNPSWGVLQTVDLDEQEAVGTVRVEDHALFVAGLVRFPATSM